MPLKVLQLTVSPPNALEGEGVARDCGGITTITPLFVPTFGSRAITWMATASPFTWL